MLFDDYFQNIQSGTFIDQPEFLPKESYDDAVDLLVDRWSSLPCCPVAIYQLGQVGAPGISDLDFVLIFPSAARIDWQQYQPDIFPEWVRQMMTHPPYCCTEEVWPELLAWYPVFNLRHLYGRILPAPVISEKLLPGCALGMLIDYLIVKVPRDFLWIAWERPLRLRILLAMLHSLKYTVKLAEMAGIAASVVDAVTIQDVDRLRVSWFDMEHDERMARTAHLCARVCFATGELIARVNLLLQTKSTCKVVTVANTKCESELFSFTSSWNFERAIKTSYDTYCKSGEITWTNPGSFLQVLGVYADESRHFRKYFARNGYETNLCWDGGIWNVGLRHHANAMINYSKCANKLSISPQKYIALGYFPPPTFLTYLLSYASNILRYMRSINHNHISS